MRKKWIVNKKKDEHLLLDHFRGIKFLKVFFLSIDRRNSESYEIKNFGYSR